MLLNNVKFNERWSAGNELHWRCTDFLSTKEQLLIRPYLNFALQKTWVLTAGYTFIQSYPYTADALPRGKPEHNIWEQMLLTHSIGNTNLSHRFRLENRFQGLLSERATGDFYVDHYTFSNRFRYRFTFRFPLNEAYFVHAFNELWIKMDKGLRYPNYDRNWLYLGLGRQIAKSGNIQLAYMHQNVRRSAVQYEVHPTVQFTFQYDFDFSDARLD